MHSTPLLWLIGFSICAAALLIGVGFTLYRDAPRSWLSHLATVVVLAGLALLQWLHWRYFTTGADVAGTRLYITLLYISAAAFYLCFRGGLLPSDTDSPWHLLHFVPALSVPWLVPAPIALPLAFTVGAAYSVALTRLVRRLRAQRPLFRLELGTFVVFAAIALVVLGLGLAAPWLGPRAFITAYSALIAIAFALALYILLRFPDLLGKASEAVRAAYAVSTLGRVDRDAALQRLRHAMDVDKVYTDEALSLARLASMVQLTPHQLSELVNTSHGIGFTRFVREHRVSAAKTMLLDEPDASVLSIGLAVGFTSQSNFYAAFREIVGDVPGRYRKSAAHRTP